MMIIWKEDGERQRRRRWRLYGRRRRTHRNVKITYFKRVWSIWRLTHLIEIVIEVEFWLLELYFLCQGDVSSGPTTSNSSLMSVRLLPPLSPRLLFPAFLAELNFCWLPDRSRIDGQAKPSLISSPKSSKADLTSTMYFLKSSSVWFCVQVLHATVS